VALRRRWTARGTGSSTDNWLRHVLDVAEKHADELASLADEPRFDRLCELNVADQVVNVSQATIVEDAWARGQELTVHDLAYALEDGLMRDLGVSVSSGAGMELSYRRILKVRARMRLELSGAMSTRAVADPRAVPR
jgi:carbonic anhydrase